MTRSSRVEAAQSKLRAIDDEFDSVAGGDYWSEKGEAGMWVRIHVTPKDVGIPSLESAWRTREENKAHHREVYQRS